MEDLAYCVRYLAEERFGAKKARETASSLKGDERALFEAYRALVNVREPMPAADEFLAAQDRMLQARIAEMEAEKASKSAAPANEQTKEEENAVSVKVCPVCGAASEDKFCPHCGAPMGE